MKTEMYVVSSYEISPSCSVKGGYIRVGEKHKKVYSMDEALAKLKAVLREMKSQDKDIYRQLMTLNANITRLKKEIKGEEEKRNQHDMELEYDDYDSIDSEDESGSDFEISDLETDDIQCKGDSTQSSGIESSELKEADSDSIHERFDSGIQEDAGYNLPSCNSVSALPRRPKSRGTAWNGERSAMYNFLLTNIGSDESSSEIEENEEGKKAKERGAEMKHRKGEQSNGKEKIHDEDKGWNLEKENQFKLGECVNGIRDMRVGAGEKDLGSCPNNTSCKTDSVMASQRKEANEFEIEQGSAEGFDEKTGQSGCRETEATGNKVNQEMVAKEKSLKKDDSIDDEDGFGLKRCQTLQPRTIEKVKAKRIVLHRRTQSEDHIRLDFNANYRTENDEQILKGKVSARDGYMKRNLEHISENEDKVAWNAFDARNYRGSERAIRREIMPIKGIRINQQLTSLENHDKKLNRSLTQLNIDGAISTNTMKAIRRSSSSLNCAVATDGGAIHEDQSKSWSMPRKMYKEMPVNEKTKIRLQKTASAFIPREDDDQKFTSGFEVGYLTHPNGIVSSTISLV